MFALHRESRADKVKEALQAAASYADDVLRDTRLQSDVRSAIDHGAIAADRVQKDGDLSPLVGRLMHDKKLRKHLRALLEDLESAGDRIRRKKTHRVRNMLLLAGVGGVALAVVPDTRRWIASHLQIGRNGDGEAIVTAT
jgi:hypothetical protein